MNVRTLVAAVVLACGCALPVAASQQQPAPPPQPPPMPEGAAISAPQIQRWFEAFTVIQAQDALNLSETQYGRFVTRLKALYESRRKHQQARNQIMGDLRRLTNPKTGSNDETQLADRLKALREEDDRLAATLKRAYESVDETLDVRQQARFRIFEERMEQQKLELLMRARQNARTATRGRGRGM
jgi:hypothetical protein